MLSLVVPLYKSEDCLDPLLEALLKFQSELRMPFECVFVVDGSPDRCAEILAAKLPSLPLRSRLVVLSRNFGAFSAIAAGLKEGQGDFFAVLAADLQEPPELLHDFIRILSAGESDIVFGQRIGRSDPWLTEVSSDLFWWIYRRYIMHDIPKGGVDVFACTRAVRDHLMSLREVDTSLVALLFWLGFRRKFVPYERRPRAAGKSAWTFGKKLRYCLNSIFNFTDLPIRILLGAGSVGIALAIVLAIAVLAARIQGDIAVPGYTPIVLSILFFGACTLLALGIIGQYLWLTLQNARSRPPYVVNSAQEFLGAKVGNAKTASTMPGEA